MDKNLNKKSEFRSLLHPLLVYYGHSVLLVVLLLSSTVLAGSGVAHQPPRNSNGFTYSHTEDKLVPWSIHVVKIERGRTDLEFHTTLGQGSTLGMGLVSAQAKSFPTNIGRPLVAINGGYYRKTKSYPGAPEGLQILEGELISEPIPSRTCFWIDATGTPHRTNVVSQCKITWPDGSSTPISLNGEREDDQAVLYTAVIGQSTRTDGGTELVLERKGDEPWLPLRIGEHYNAQVRAVRAAGDTPLGRGVMVLSLGPKLSPMPKVAPGALLQISTMTIPDLSGAKTALAGGPTLVHCGKVTQSSGFQIRHPRTAVGWNKDYFFMVEVDGRQRNLSVGMTIPELADYMVKLGCEEAVNFDGGGSATMWVLGNVMNSPSEGQERPGANALVLTQKPQK